MGVWSPFVDAYEMHGTAQEQHGERGMTASVQLKCPWSLRHTLAIDVVANRRPWPKGSGLIVPLGASASISPFPSKGSVNSTSELIHYEEALVTIQYSMELETIDGVVDSIEPTAEFIVLSHRGFRWGASDGDFLKEEEAPGYLLRGLNFVRVFPDRSFPPSPATISLVGRVNQNPVTSTQLGFTFAAETLLFNPPTLTRSMQSNGAARYSQTVKFTYKPEGWNKYFRARTQQWESLYIAGGAEYKSYVPANLTPVLS